MDDFEKFYIGKNPVESLDDCLDSFKDLGLTRVSSSNRYSENLNPPITDKTVVKPGEDGTYYFSSTLGSTTHSISAAFDKISEEQLRKLKQIQSSKEFWKLTYDNLPFKYYIVKPTGTSKISYVPFYENEQRLYKGEATLEFICYEGYAHCWVENKDEFYIYPAPFETNIALYSDAGAGSNYYTHKTQPFGKAKTQVEVIINNGETNKNLLGSSKNHRLLVFGSNQTRPSGTNFQIISSSALSTPQKDYLELNSDGTLNISFFPYGESISSPFSQEDMNTIVNNINSLEIINHNTKEKIYTYNREEEKILKPYFSNLDEWKDACGLFDETTYIMQESQVAFDKVETTDTTILRYEAFVTDEQGFFNEHLPMIVNLEQGKKDLNLESSIKSQLVFIYKDNSKIEIDLEKNTSSVKLLKTENNFIIRCYQSNLPVKDIQYPKTFDTSFTTIKWILLYPNVLSKNYVYDLQEPKTAVGMGGLYFITKNISFNNPLEKKLVAENLYNLPMNFVATFRTGVAVNLPFTGTWQVSYIGENGQATHETASFNITELESSKTFIIEGEIGNYIADENKYINEIRLDFFFNQSFSVYKNSGTLTIELNFESDPIPKKLTSLYYLENSEINNDVFINQGNFLYTFYKNISDKATQPIISIANVPVEARKIGVYLSDGLTNSLILNKDDYNLIFSVVDNKSPMIINNEKCLLTQNDIFINDLIEWGDFFKIDANKECFIYLVCLDNNYSPIFLKENPTALIQSRYKFY